MTTSRRSGTNEHISTYGGVTKEYTALATWEGVFDVDLTNMWKVAITPIAGTFQLNETLTFVGSGATGTFIENPTGTIVFVKTAGTPAVNDTITGGTSLATATLNSITFQNGVSPVLECYTGSYADAITMAGTTANATYFRIIRPAPGNSHNGTPGGGGVVFTDNSVGTIVAAEAYCSIQDLILTESKSLAVGTVWCITGAANASYIGNICKSTNADIGDAGGIFVSHPSTGQKAINNLCYECKTQGIQTGGRNSITNYVYNNTVINCGTYGIRFQTNTGTTGVVVSTNNLCTGNGTDFAVFGGTMTITQTYCVSYDATADDWGGAGNHTGHTAVGYVDAANDNWHLANTDTQAIDLGTDLSADGVFAFDDDIDKETRIGTWDIGFDEYISTAVALSPTMSGNKFWNPM